MMVSRLVISISSLVTILSLCALFPGVNVAGEPPALPSIRATIVAEVGQTVRLFHGGTEEAKKLFCKDEVVPIYRYDRTMQRKQVGKVKLGVFVGEQFIDGIVVEGEIRRGDMAIKGSAACLVVEPPGGQEK